MGESLWPVVSGSSSYGHRRVGKVAGCQSDCEPEFLRFPPLERLFLALPGDVPRVTCRHTLSPPEVAGIQRYVSALAPTQALSMRSSR